MSKMNVNRRGQINTSKNVTLRHLSSGETFRFHRSAPGVVYQMLTVSERARVEAGVDSGDLRFVYSNVSTGQIFGDTINRTVLLVDCSLVARDRISVDLLSTTERRSWQKLQVALSKAVNTAKTAKTAKTRKTRKTAKTRKTK